MKLREPIEVEVPNINPHAEVPPCEECGHDSVAHAHKVTVDTMFATHHKKPQGAVFINPYDTPVAMERVLKRQGRNEPCSCGSGHKYKNCHGKLKQ